MPPRATAQPPSAAPITASLPARPPLVEVRQLRKTYRTGIAARQRVEALRGVSLEVLPGEIFGLLGPNGAGKTTLIKVLLGIVRSSGGSASVLGKPAGSVASRRRIGYLPENLRIERHHTARTALTFYGRLSNLSGRALDQRIDGLIETVGLRGRDREPIKRFSKGMNQRLGMAQALLNDPDLLILDEPTDGLDPVGRSDVRTLLRQLREQGKSVLMNSHILQEVELVCDRVAIMTGGLLRSVGKIDELTHAAHVGKLVIHVSDDQAGLAAEALAAQGMGVPHRGLTTLRGTVPISVEVEDQPTTDHCVDRLRQAGISILGLEIRRPSLEDVFLQVVRSHPADDDAPLTATLAAAPDGPPDRS